MMSVSCKTGDLPCEYDICFADDMRFGVHLYGDRILWYALIISVSAL